MSDLAVIGLVAAVLMFIVLIELLSAAVPLLIVVTLVPPAERPALADCLAAADSRRRLRLWPALRAAAEARRRTAHQRDGSVPADAVRRWDEKAGTVRQR
ncbi:hypothetical protein [Symbioplanes lichenis]|uniref:hypothetical protein n=1 Tax=Symbioplanes lichenis TaxID=1629072 RepID=UPI0027392847|nr:hypothetical protein [Actinoplanes lichenis]